MSKLVYDTDHAPMSQSDKTNIYLIDKTTLTVFESNEVWVLADNQWMHFEGRFAEAVRRRFLDMDSGTDLDYLIATGIPGTERLGELLASEDKRPVTTTLAPAHPAMLFIELTDHCNLSCRHCYGEAGPEGAMVMPLGHARAVIEDAASMGFSRVQLTGGEPLLHPHLTELAHLAKNRDIPTLEIFTNGNALTPAILEALPAETTFALSFYSANPEVHDRITGVKGSGQATVKAIDLLVDRGFQVRVAVILMEENASDWEETRRFLISRGVSASNVRAGSTSAVGRGTYFQLPRQDDTTCNDDGVNSDARPSLVWPGKAAVSARGEVFPCIFARWISLGNIYERSLADILSCPDPFRGDPMPVPERWNFCSERLSCPDCRVMVFGIMGANRA